MTETDLSLSPAEHAAMRHALGCSSAASPGYRNYYCAAGDAVALWEGLQARGFATREDGHYPTFFVTLKGLDALEAYGLQRTPRLIAVCTPKGGA